MKPAWKLADLSYEEINAMRLAIEADPKNARTGSLFLFTPKAMKKLDALAWAVTYKLQRERRSIVERKGCANEPQAP